MDKCADCGFLCLITIAHGSYVGADYQYRTEGSQGGILTERAHGPHCLLHAEELHNEQGKNVTAKEALVIISQPRDDCKSFIRWRPGCTPKEHLEMMDREKMLEWQAEREESDKKWREQQEKWRSKEEWKRYRFLAVITVVAVIIGVILGKFL